MPKKSVRILQHKEKASILACFLFLCLFSFAQQKLTVTGNVVTEDNIPLAGVSVNVQGASSGTTTDAEGRFTIQLNRGATLVLSFIGYEEQHIKVNNEKDVASIIMVSKQSSLGEVVVVAYGTQKKATVTGAIASIQTKEIKQSPAANLAVTLAGRLPGLIAIQTSGEPGRDITNLYIRGRGTINSQSPIMLVDGIERDLTSIDPNDIATVTILKDASSTALFGVRGANGVILVTTRRGSSEIPEISFSAETGMQDFPRFIQPVSSYDYAVLKNLALKNDGLSEIYSSDILEKYRTGSDPLRFPNTDLREILLKDYSRQERYNLNVSGAGKAVKYFVSAGYLNQGGIFNVEKDLNYDPSFFLKRYNFRSNIDIQLNKTLKAFLNVSGYIGNQNGAYGGVLSNIGDINDPNSTASVWILDNIAATPAILPGVLTPDGEVLTMSNAPQPPYGQVNRTGYIQRVYSNVNATYGMQQDLDFITEGLSAKAVLSFDSKTTNNLFAGKTYEKWVQIINPNLTGMDGGDSVYYQLFNNEKNTPLSISGSRYFSSTFNFQGYLNYNRTFHKHTVSGLVLYQQQKTTINAELPYNLKGVASRLTYGFDNRYFAEFNAGYNGSEQFAKGRRFGFFPAFSGAWLVSNEKFMSNVRIIDHLKLRGSYGLVGNDRIGSRRFLYLDDIQVIAGGYTTSLGNGQYVVTSLLKNHEITWETAKKVNIGLEIGLKNGLGLMVDVFQEKRDNILRNRGTVPVLNGLPISVLPPVNIGKVVNRGYEIELNYKKSFNKDLFVLAKANLNYSKNKQTFADEPLLPEEYAFRYRQTGYTIGQRFGYIVEGYFSDAEDIEKSPVQSVGGHASRPGDFKYRDLNGDGVVDLKDQAPIGYSSVPEYTFGGVLNVGYKNFDISFLFQGVSHVTNYITGNGVFSTANFVARHLESWTAERAANGDPINYPRLTTQTSPNEIANSFFIVNTSYIRLKNLELGYTLPAEWSKKISSRQIRIYANGLNLFTWDKLPTHEFDPELINNTTYPIERIFNFGINLTF
jgi:TonB-linked SusC/RagA family outer membrane protein